MLKIFLLVYFLECNINHIHLIKKPKKGSPSNIIRKKIFNIKTNLSKFKTFKFPSLGKEKFKFFTGKIFELYYSDMKIIENKINLNYNLMETEVLLGTHFQLNGCLVLKDFPKKFYFYDRKKIFQFYHMKNFQENTTLNAVSYRKFISSDVKKSVFFFQNFHFFYNFKSRLNSAFFEKSWNIKINRKKDYDLYFRKKKNCLVKKCGFLRNYKIIESRRKRIFNLQIKSKILKNIHGGGRFASKFSKRPF